MIIPVQPPPPNGIENHAGFEEQWNEHASFVQSTGGAYTRHRSLNISPDRLARIFDHTQFDHRLVVGQGGYEEFLFDSRAAAESFFGQYAKEI